LQEGAAYRGTIRRHVDLEVVRGNLEASTASRATATADGDSCYPASEFYRDLLLLCTNAVVFFPRSDPEHAAARALVSEHASAVLRELKQEHACCCRRHRWAADREREAAHSLPQAELHLEGRGHE
jgi:hypothetical protein